MTLVATKIIQFEPPSGLDTWRPMALGYHVAHIKNERKETLPNSESKLSQVKLSKPETVEKSVDETTRTEIFLIGNACSSQVVEVRLQEKDPNPTVRVVAVRPLERLFFHRPITRMICILRAEPQGRQPSEMHRLYCDMFSQRLLSCETNGNLGLRAKLFVDQAPGSRLITLYLFSRAHKLFGKFEVLLAENSGMPQFVGQIVSANQAIVSGQETRALVAVYDMLLGGYVAVEVYLFNFKLRTYQTVMLQTGLTGDIFFEDLGEIFCINNNSCLEVYCLQIVPDPDSGRMLEKLVMVHRMHHKISFKKAISCVTGRFLLIQTDSHLHLAKWSFEEMSFVPCSSVQALEIQKFNWDRAGSWVTSPNSHYKASLLKSNQLILHKIAVK